MSNVDIAQTTLIDSSKNAEEEGTPYAYWEEWETSSREFSPGPYTSGGAVEKHNIALNQQIATISLSEVAGFMVEKLFPGSTLPVSTGIGNGLEHFFNWCNANTPSAKTLYCTRQMWRNNKTEGTPTRIIKYYIDDTYRKAVDSDTFYN